jgi:hypothetical protein
MEHLIEASEKPKLLWQYKTIPLETAFRELTDQRRGLHLASLFKPERRQEQPVDLDLFEDVGARTLNQRDRARVAKTY